MKKSKIMVIDDYDVILDMTKLVLKEAGFEVIARAGGMGATDAALSEKPDCVLMDVSMPLIKGPKLVRVIKTISNIK